MTAPKRCTATTKAGKRCKNRVKPGLGNTCPLHSQVLVAKPAPTTKFEQIERGAKIVSGISAGVGGLIKIIEFVGHHWPQIHHYFTTATAQILTTEELKERVQAGTLTDAQCANNFERWFSRLPVDVRSEVRNQFGDIRALIASVREPS